MVPTFILEEHHEAFLAWYYAIKNRWIPADGNVLFHVDEHADFDAPQFNISINEVNEVCSLKVIKEFTYSELNIASFIIPFCYQGRCREVYWVRQKHHQVNRGPKITLVRSFNQEGKKLLYYILNSTGGKRPDDRDCKTLIYSMVHEEELESRQNVILDVDLDYFSCTEIPQYVNELKINITEEEYQRFIADQYHPIRYLVARTEANHIGNQYYLTLNGFQDVYPSSLCVDFPEIDKRIDRFISILQDKDIAPRIIDICRSRHSGYTPADQWEYIEKRLLHMENTEPRGAR